MGTYATDNNTMKVEIGGKDTKKNKNLYHYEFIIWLTAESRFDNLLGDKRILIIGEIYRRLRKIPEFNGSVAILFAQSEYSICKKHKLEQEEYDAILRDLIENEIVNVVYSAMEYKVLSLDRSIFVTNYIYYKECGTDSKDFAEFSMKYDIETMEAK